MLVSQPLNAGAAKTPPWSKGKNRCGTPPARARVAPPLPRWWLGRRSLGIPSFPHRLLPSSDRAGLQPLPARESAACHWLPLPLRSLRQPPASRCVRSGVSERVRAASAWRRKKQECPLPPPLTLALGGCRRCHGSERGGVPSS